MPDPSPHLPPGFSKLHGAVVGGDWFICWLDAQTAAWSRDSGWIMLPDCPAKITTGHATFEGILLLGEPNRVGFWEWGAADWSWWRFNLGFEYTTNLALTGSYLIETRKPATETMFRIWRATPADLVRVARITHQAASRVVAATIDRESGELLIACDDGFYRYIPSPGSGKIQKTSEFSIDLPYGARPAISGHDRAVAFQSTIKTIEVDFTSTTANEIELVPVGGCNALWRAYVSGDMCSVPFILDTLHHVPRFSLHQLIDGPLFDLVFHDDLSATVATPDGLLDVQTVWRCPDCGEANKVGEENCRFCEKVNPGCPLPACQSSCAVDNYPSEVLSWKLEIDHEGALGEAIDLLFGDHLVNNDALVGSFCRAAGNEAGSMIFEYSRGRNPHNWSQSDLDRVALVFGRFGSRNAELVRESLTDRDPAVIAIGLAAAAETAANDKPLLWGEKQPVPQEEIRELLHHESEKIAVLALRACSSLKLVGCLHDIGAMIDHENPILREKAIEAFGQLPSPNPKWCDRIADLMVCDVDEQVRSQAVDFTAGCATPEAYLDNFIQVLADTCPSPRTRASDAVTSMARRLSADQLFRVCDTVILLLMASNVDHFDSDFELGIVDMFAGMMESLAGAIHQEAHGDTPPMDPELPIRFEFIFLMALFAARLTDGRYELEPDDFVEMKALFKEMDVETPVTDAEIGITTSENAGIPPLSIIRRTIEKEHHRLARRLAILALFVRREDARKRLIEENQIPDAEYVPLHLQLRKKDHSENLLRLCRDLVKDQATKVAPACLPALFCLSASGDEGAAGELANKIVSGATRDSPVVPAAFIQLLDFEGRRGFMERLLFAESVPLRTRYSLFDKWDADAFGALADSLILPFLRLCASSQELAREDRLDAARLLADRGETGQLEGLLNETDPSTLDPDRLYQYSFDMVRAGHHEYLDNIRGEWIERGDLEALKIFAATGNERDILELERALELNAPEQMIHETIDAIKRRFEKPE